jgi:hypothetical protein
MVLAAGLFRVSTRHSIAQNPRDIDQLAPNLRSGPLAGHRLVRAVRDASGV